jgi:hypothetical protein
MYMLIPAPPRGEKSRSVEAPVYPLITFGTTKQLTVLLLHRHSMMASTYTDDELNDAMIATAVIG